MSLALSLYLGSFFFSNVQNVWSLALIEVESIYSEMGPLFFYAVLAFPVFLIGLYVALKLIEILRNHKVILAIAFGLGSVLIFMVPFYLTDFLIGFFQDGAFLNDMLTLSIKILIGAVPFTWVYALFVKDFKGVAQ